jgi:hypothetical protein
MIEINIYKNDSIPFIYTNPHHHSLLTLFHRSCKKVHKNAKKYSSKANYKVKDLQLYMNAAYCLQPIFVWNKMRKNTSTFQPADEACTLLLPAGIITLMEPKGLI